MPNKTTTQTNKKQTFLHQFQQDSTCDICIKAHRRYGKLNFRHSSSGIYNNNTNQVINTYKPEGCHCDEPYKEEKEYDDDDSDYSSSDEDIILGHSCASCSKIFSTETKLHIHMANIHAREEIKGNIKDFYCLVGNSIIGIDYYQDKMDRLTDLIDALQVNVNRMKRLTTIKE